MSPYSRKFDYDSLIRKYENFTGKPVYRNNVDLAFIRDHFICVAIGNGKISGNTPDIKILDWCENAFGDDWIYEWNRFYFKNPKDATLFRLKWAT